MDFDADFSSAMRALEEEGLLQEFREPLPPAPIGPFYPQFCYSQLERVIDARAAGEIKDLAERLARDIIAPRVNHFGRAFQLPEKKLAKRYDTTRERVHKAKHMLKELEVMRLWKYQKQETGESSWFVVHDSMLEWHF